MHENGVDSLTGLPDEARFLQHLSASLRALRPGAASLAVLLIEVDDFADLDARMGRHAGGRLLKTVAGRIVANKRRVDLAARLGGHRFAVLCEGLASEEAVIDIAARLLDSIAQPLDESDEIVTACMGIAIAGSTAVEPTDLTRQAELALRRAAKHGRLRFHIFDPMLPRGAGFDPEQITPS